MSTRSKSWKRRVNACRTIHAAGTSAGSEEADHLPGLLEDGIEAGEGKNLL
jgi:hypothetical protein